VRRMAFALLAASTLLPAGCTALRENTAPVAETTGECPPGGCTAPDGSAALITDCPPAPTRTVVGPRKAESPMPANDTENLLAYFSRVRKLAGTEVTREYESVRQVFARARTDSNRVRYAMLLSIPGTAFNDETRALETLDPLLNNTASKLYPLALLMGTQIQTQRREHELSQKLDALKSLDKSLIERGY
jgi:hypothetical protein